MKSEPDTIPWNGPIPEALLPLIRDDFPAIVNHMIKVGIFAKVGLEQTFYPLAEGDNSGSPKPIPPYRILRDLCKQWFLRHYGGKYAVHYLDSAASFAMQLIRSWRTNGGDIAALPKVRKPMARLNNDLYTIQRMEADGTARLRITLAPRESIVMEIRVFHRNFARRSKGRAGALVLLPHGLRLCFTGGAELPNIVGHVGADCNLNSLDLARSDGEVRTVDLGDVVAIQQAHKQKRESVQRTVRNPAKAQRIMAKTRGRERNRVRDRLHKKIHGRDNEVLSFVGRRVFGFEDLTGLSPRDRDRGARFNSQLSSWARGKIQGIVRHHHPATRNDIYARGTSTYCPFCGSKLSHPKHDQGERPISRCPVHGDLNRQILSAVSVLVRTIHPKHRRGEPWRVVKDVLPPSEEAKLLLNSLLKLNPADAGMGNSFGGGPTAPPKSVGPECAVLYPEARSDIGGGPQTAVMQKRREADRQLAAEPKWVKSGNDANRVYVCLHSKEQLSTTMVTSIESTGRSRTGPAMGPRRGGSIFIPSWAPAGIQRRPRSKLNGGPIGRFDAPEGARGFPVASSPPCPPRKGAAPFPSCGQKEPPPKVYIGNQNGCPVVRPSP